MLLIQWDRLLRIIGVRAAHRARRLHALSSVRGSPVIVSASDQVVPKVLIVIECPACRASVVVLVVRVVVLLRRLLIRVSIAAFTPGSRRRSLGTALAVLIVAPGNHAARPLGRAARCADSVFIVVVVRRAVRGTALGGATLRLREAL